MTMVVSEKSGAPSALSKIYKNKNSSIENTNV